MSKELCIVKYCGECGKKLILFYCTRCKKFRKPLWIMQGRFISKKTEKIIKKLEREGLM
jgi:hypothetical protein